MKIRKKIKTAEKYNAELPPHIWDMSKLKRWRWWIDAFVVAFGSLALAILWRTGVLVTGWQWGVAIVTVSIVGVSLPYLAFMVYRVWVTFRYEYHRALREQQSPKRDKDAGKH